MSRPRLANFPATVVCLAILFQTAYAFAEDCNGNSIDDAQDIALGTSADCDENGWPDECTDLGVDIVFVVDSSTSMGSHAFTVCSEAGELLSELNSLGITDHTRTILKVNNASPQVTYSCLDGNVITLGTSVPIFNACSGLSHEIIHQESWLRPQQS